MKRILILVASILLLAGATVGLMKFMEMGPFEPENEVKVIEKIKEDDDYKSLFIGIDPILIPIFKGNIPVAKIQIQIKLETRSEENAIQIKRMIPRIRDIFIQDLHAFMPRLLKEKERIDVLILKKRLQLIADRKFGKGLIEDILVQSILDTES